MLKAKREREELQVLLESGRQAYIDVNRESWPNVKELTEEFKDDFIRLKQDSFWDGTIMVVCSIGISFGAFQMFNEVTDVLLAMTAWLLGTLIGLFGAGIFLCYHLPLAYYTLVYILRLPIAIGEDLNKAQDEILINEAKRMKEGRRQWPI